MSFDVGPDAQTGWGHLSLDASGVTVDVVRLDAYCQEREIEWVDVLKVDVEGADAWVLEGARRYFSEHRGGTVFFEEEPDYMRRFGIEPGTPGRLLLEAGYEVRRVGPGEFMATCPGSKRRG